jgi:hypothetical protein
MISVVKILRLGQKFFCRKVDKAMKTRRGDNLDPETGYALKNQKNA